MNRANYSNKVIRYAIARHAMQQRRPPENNQHQYVLLRRGWTVNRLWIISIVGMTGLALDAAFHTLDSGTPLTIIFDGADFSTGEMVLTSSPEIATLSWMGHTMFLAAFALLIVLPKVFFDKSPWKERAAGGRTWTVLRQGRTVKQLWMIAMVGAAGMALDVAFHWLQDGSPEQVLTNGTDNPNQAISALALAAHIMFISAFTMLMCMPKILFARHTTTMPVASR
ncbi:MAG TPA: hypothetical protein VNI77_10220 [Nitrososphaera sp.]|nr:hypothetical protein [Nitrososphaera sp.]